MNKQGLTTLISHYKSHDLYLQYIIIQTPKTTN